MSLKELKQKYFSTGGMIIITILGLIGLILFLFSGVIYIGDWELFSESIKNNGIVILFGFFFFFVSLYSWIGYFKNIILKPKQETLYLYKKEGNTAIFINSKGKQFIIERCLNQENKYYETIKTKDYILEVLEESNNEFDTIPKEKKSYWLNFYSPVGNYEAIFLLPIVYVIFLFGILTVFAHNLIGIIYCVVPGFLILYDLIYKIKLAKSKNGYVDTTGLNNMFEMLKKIALITIAFIICFIFVSIFNAFAGTIDKLIFSPFLIAGLCFSGRLIGVAFNNLKLQNFFNKAYSLIFLIFWFGFLIFWSFGIVEQEGSLIFLLFTIPFYLAGIFMVYKIFIKK